MDDVVRLSDAAEQLGIGYAATLHRVFTGELKGFKDADGKRYVYRSSLNAYKASQRAASSVPAVA